ncbi:hypothetical protein [Streptomyces sp. NPDC096311]|uniref:hypothetical protein n=1 Tax=Streptomyces sp. NPDC096311 TaxID=3366083 RepID=UPI00381FBD41
MTTAARHLLPLSRLGFAVAALSGAAMFVSGATSVGNSGAAPWKLGLIVVAGISIAVFHKGVYRTVDHWDLGTGAPVRARAAATVSALTWTGVIVSGRLLAYT